MKTLSDITAPVAVTRKLLEADVQKQCVDWARARGYWARKFSSMTTTAEPDYLFARKVPRSEIPPRPIKLKFWTEFKRPGNTSTEAQLEEQAAMRLAGWDGFECDNFEYFKHWVIEREEMYV